MVFNGQTITVSLDTDIDLAGYDGFILYEKPNGVNGEWEADISGDTVTYDVQPDDTANYPGVWKVQAKATNGNDVKFGKVQVIEFRSHL
jgi:hypothetical protein